MACLRSAASEYAIIDTGGCVALRSPTFTTNVEVFENDFAVIQSLAQQRFLAHPGGSWRTISVDRLRKWLKHKLAYSNEISLRRRLSDLYDLFPLLMASIAG